MYSSKIVFFNFWNKLGEILHPDEDRLARIINSVGLVVAIGCKDLIVHMSWVDCMGGPVLAQIEQNPVSNLMWYFDP
jgi:hypothetical protein